MSSLRRGVGGGCEYPSDIRGDVGTHRSYLEDPWKEVVPAIVSRQYLPISGHFFTGVAGNSSTPTLVISDLEPGQLYQVYVSAANEAGESDLSEPATATPIELAKAA